MSTEPKASSSAAPVIFAERYRIDRLLGRGGMAIADEVTDLQTGKRVALKRMLAENPEHESEIEHLFEREYFALSQLEHPRVVQVYDFARDECGRPYYTMELLDGGDLRDLAPLSYTKLCPLLADVCSALSLLQSRRLVHRDITPRNILCTSDGKAKLIDFGTILPFGIARRTVGTPPFCCPEALSGQALDGRSDLFALGATAYYALTRQHAYPARDFGMLPSMWNSPLAPPSALAPDIPEALDRLILSLLRLQPEARPENAAEVMERLSAIVPFDSSEYEVVSQAYLSSPTLVGRDGALQRAQKLMRRTLEGRGGILVASGGTGIGRTRFLGACVLAGKLQGMATAQVDPTSGGTGPFSAVLDVLRQLEGLQPQLLESLHDQQREAILALRDQRRRSTPPPADPEPSTDSAPGAQENHNTVQDALLSAVFKASRDRPLLLAVDDFERVDHASAAIFALLGAELQRRRAIALVASVHENAAVKPLGAVHLMLDQGRHIKLKPLSQESSTDMLSSMVGQVRGLPELAEHLHQIANGVPSLIVQLAEHLLSTGHLRYQAGTWTISENFRGVRLPGSLEGALALKLDRLSPRATNLAQGLALLPDHSADVDALLILGQQPDCGTQRDEILSALDELMRVDIIGTDGDDYWLRHTSLVPLLIQRLQSEARRQIHRRICALYESRPGGSVMSAYHLVLAGEPAAGMELLLGTFDGDFGNAKPEELQALATDAPDDLVSVLGKLADHASASGAPLATVFQIHRWTALVGIVTGEGSEHFQYLFKQLRHDCGLDIYEQLPDTMPAGDRLTAAFTKAQQRYDESPEHLRVMTPLQAVQDAAKSIVTSLALFGVMLDYDALEKAPNLQPFALLSPAVEVVAENRAATLDLVGSRYESALARWQAVLDRLSQDDHAGIDPVHHTYIRLAVLYGMANIDATLGREAAITRANELGQDPLFALQAERTKMIYAFRLGDVESALRHKRKIELLRLRRRSRELLDGGHVMVEMQCYASADDPFRLKGVIPDAERQARRYKTWVPVLHLARGYYDCLRHRPENARKEMQAAFDLTKPGRHVVWGYAAAGLVHSASALGHHQEACERGEQYLSQAIAHGLEHAHTIREALARALQLAGELDRARIVAQEAIAGWDALGAHGTLLGAALETGARIALHRGDEQEFSELASRCAQVFGRGKNAGLSARYDALMRDAQKILCNHRGEDYQCNAQRTRLSKKSMYNGLHSPLERAMHSARRLASRTGTEDVLLYLVTADGPALRGRHGTGNIPAAVEEQVRHLLRTAGLEDDDEDDDEIITATATAGSTAMTTAGESRLAFDGTSNPLQTGFKGRIAVPVMMFHESDSGTLATGIVVFITHSRLGFVPPYRLMARISAALTAAGDTTPIPLHSSFVSDRPPA